MRKLNLKKKLLVLGTTVAVAFAVATGAVVLKHENASAVVSCQDGAVVCGGVSTPQDVADKMENGDGVHSDLKAIYNGLGIYKQDILSPNMVNGTVNKSGQVIVNGQVVATGVVNGWRKQLPGSYQASGLWWTTPGQNFASANLSSLVYMRNGKFVYAIIRTCGNPVFITNNRPGITVDKRVANLSGDKIMQDNNEARPGDTLEYAIKVTNPGDTNAVGTTIKDLLPAHVTMIPGTAELRYGSTKYAIQDKTVTGGMNGGGVRIQSFPPSQVTYLVFQAKIDSNITGCINLTNTGTAKGDYTARVSDEANTRVCGEQEQQNYNITVRKYNDVDGDATRDSGESLLSDWTFTIKGNGLDQTEDTDANGSITFAGLNPGTYTITETMKSGWRSTTGVTKTVTVGPDQIVMFGNQKTTTPPTPVPTPTPSQPTSLPVSGPVDTAAGVVGTGALGYAGYMWRRSRKALKNTLMSK